jgi:alpha-beta hydrolase superfamily lysophospholipase
MIPIHFGTPERPLFGWHHAPARTAEVCRGGVVLCPPFGWELVRSYRSFRHLAERLSASGFHVLRFDYDGTGESAGADGDPGRLRAWRGSIGSAIDELRARSGLSTASVFGARLGATLALLVAAERGDVSSVVAWAPALTGRAYLREMRAFRRLAQTDAGGGLADGDEEAAGFLFTAETIGDLGRIDLLALERKPAPRVLVLARDELSTEGKLATHLEGLGVSTELRRIPGFGPMVLNELHRSVVPDQVFASAIEWLGGVPPAVAPAREPGPAASSTARMATARGPVREEALFFGPEARLFGILTEPLEPNEAAARSARPGIVLLNNGAVHRMGSQRLYVAMAREWASLGFSVLRMDLGGLGDSLPETGREENLMYATSAVADVATSLRWLETRGLSRFVLVGLCAGAYASFHAGLAGLPVAGTVLINPQTFYWKEGDPLDEAPSEVYNNLRQYKASLRSPRKWMKMVRGGVSLPRLAGLLRARARILVQARMAAFRRGLGRDPGRGDLGADLRTLVKAGIEVFMVFSANDPGLDYIDLHARKQVRRLSAQPSFRIETIEGPDHTFTPLWSQRRLIDTLTAHFQQRHQGMT